MASRKMMISCFAQRAVGQLVFCGLEYELVDLEGANLESVDFLL